MSSSSAAACSGESKAGCTREIRGAVGARAPPEYTSPARRHRKSAKSLPTLQVSTEFIRCNR
jgi:hypothetical protein